MKDIRFIRQKICNTLNYVPKWNAASEANGLTNNPGWKKILPWVSCEQALGDAHLISQGYQVIAFDGSEEMVRLSSELLGKKVLLMDFNNIDLKEKYDGIWACV